MWLVIKGYFHKNVFPLNWFRKVFLISFYVRFFVPACIQLDFESLEDKSKQELLKLVGWRKLRKGRTWVNFINIIRAAFTYISFARSFLCLRFRFVLYWRKTIGPKAVRRTLMKLNPCHATASMYSNTTVSDASISNLGQFHRGPFLDLTFCPMIGWFLLPL